MKKIFLGSILLIASVNSFAQNTCKQLYLESRNDTFLNWDAHNYDREDGRTIALATGGTGLMTGGILAMSGLGVSTILILPGAGLAAIGAVEGVIALTNIKENKMIDFLNQSIAYYNNGGQGVPGRLLKKFHKKISKIHDELSVFDIARWVAEGNRDGSLCKSSVSSFRRILKYVKSGDIKIVDADEAE